MTLRPESLRSHALAPWWGIRVGAAAHLRGDVSFDSMASAKHVMSIVYLAATIGGCGSDGSNLNGRWRARLSHLDRP